MVGDLANGTYQRIVPGNYWGSYGTIAVPIACANKDPRPQIRTVSNGTTDNITNHRMTEVHNGLNNDDRLKSFLVGLFMTIIVACAIVSFATAFGMLSSTASAQDTAVETICVAVEPGESLWTIAQEHPIQGMSTQQCVRWIIQYNNLTNASVSAWQIIEVPTVR